MSRSRSAAVGLISLLLLASPGLAQTVAPVEATGDSAERFAGDVNSGRFVALGGAFGDLRIDCVRCHGFAGAGDPTGAFPRLADQSAWYLYKTLHDFASGERPSEIMGPVARTLSDEQLRDVAAYFASIEDAPYPPPPQEEVEVLQAGGAIAAVGVPEQGVPACSSCHGASGIGDFPVVPSLAGQYAGYLERQLQLFRAGVRKGDPMGVMRKVAQGMTDEQIHAVSRYFATVRPEAVTARADEPALPAPQPLQRGQGTAIPSTGLEPGPVGVVPELKGEEPPAAGRPVPAADEESRPQADAAATPAEPDPALRPPYLPSGTGSGGQQPSDAGEQ